MSRRTLDDLSLASLRALRDAYDAECVAGPITQQRAAEGAEIERAYMRKWLAAKSAEYGTADV